ncbi:hypothetical protein M378DRAFT_161254 [Amanita muscaria Koide BX008]|uniref:Uncharacterized protein n=1 Tax=Amanita muscaria (strain Koide BX008) TaxID=946122 RepID=A0A0C2SRX5_AMAMK|nr:hypothetical protein M378DRAFT_161254 [Amanita muscaria Koide BX008]
MGREKMKKTSVGKENSGRCGEEDKGDGKNKYSPSGFALSILSGSICGVLKASLLGVSI